MLLARWSQIAYFVVYCDFFGGLKETCPDKPATSDATTSGELCCAVRPGASTWLSGQGFCHACELRAGVAAWVVPATALRDKHALHAAMIPRTRNQRTGKIGGIY